MPSVDLASKSLAALQELPCLIVHGNMDEVVQPEEAEKWAELLGPQANVAMLPGGHIVYLESPHKFVKLVSDFLANVEDEEKQTATARLFIGRTDFRSSALLRWRLNNIGIYHIT